MLQLHGSEQTRVINEQSYVTVKIIMIMKIDN